MTRTTSTSWFLCEILSGPDAGHHCYCSISPDGRVFIIRKGGKRAMFKSMDAAAGHIRRCRNASGEPIRVARQSFQWDRWFEAGPLGRAA